MLIFHETDGLFKGLAKVVAIVALSILTLGIFPYQLSKHRKSLASKVQPDQQAYASLKQQLDATQKELNAARAQAATTPPESHQDILKRLQAKDKELSEAQQKLLNPPGKNKEMSKTQKDLNEQLAKAKGKIEELNQEIANLQASLRNQTSEALSSDGTHILEENRLKEEADKLDKKLKAAQTELTEAKAENEELQKQHVELTNQLSKLKEEMKTASEGWETQPLDEDLKSRNDLTELLQDKKNLITDLETAKNENAKLQAMLKKSTNTSQEQLNLIAQKEKEIISLNQKIQQQRDASKAMNGLVNKLKDDKFQLTVDSEEQRITINTLIEAALKNPDLNDTSQMLKSSYYRSNAQPFTNIVSTGSKNPSEDEKAEEEEEEEAAPNDNDNDDLNIISNILNFKLPEAPPGSGSISVFDQIKNNQRQLTKTCVNWSLEDLQKELKDKSNNGHPTCLKTLSIRNINDLLKQHGEGLSAKEKTILKDGATQIGEENASTQNSMLNSVALEISKKFQLCNGGSCGGSNMTNSTWDSNPFD